jgi:thiamine-monophosphate kinase
MSTRRTVLLPATRPGELSLLSQIRSRAARISNGAVSLGIGDDCALLRLGPGEELAVTTDLSIAGRHFQLDWHPPESVGHRALARGLSDLAAMGARPVAAFLSLGLPGELTKSSARKPSWITRFYDGLLALAKVYRTPLAGGDLAESPTPVADIVLVGAVPRGKAMLRSGARPGHLLYVTGSLGGSGAGLAQLEDLAAASKHPGHRPLNISANLATQLASHLYPQPRIPQGLWLRQRALATAAIDLSDSLSTDLAHLCTESSVTAEIDSARLPIHPGTTLEQALHGGEDYELLFTAPPSVQIPQSVAGVPITRIGRILGPRKGRPLVAMVTAEGKHPLEPHGWEHFS